MLIVCPFIKLDDHTRAQLARQHKKAQKSFSIAKFQKNVICLQLPHQSQFIESDLHVVKTKWRQDRKMCYRQNENTSTTRYSTVLSLTKCSCLVFQPECMFHP